MSAYICSRIKTIEQDCVHYLIALLVKLGCSLTASLGLFYFMNFLEKDLEQIIFETDKGYHLTQNGFYK